MTKAHLTLATGKMVGHRTQAIYRRYAIADESMLRDGAAKLAALHDADAAAAPIVVRLEAARPARERHA
jgi:hypothetical protein